MKNSGQVLYFVYIIAMEDEETEKFTFYPVLKKLLEDNHFMCKQQRNYLHYMQTCTEVEDTIFLLYICKIEQVSYSLEFLCIYCSYMKITRRKHPDHLVDFCKGSSVNRMAAGSRSSHGFFFYLLSPTFQTHLM